MIVLGNIPVIEIGDPKIEENVEKKGKIKNNKVKSIISYPYNILNVPVNSEYKNRFDKQVEWKKQSKVCEKFSLHKKKIKSFREQKLFMETSKK